MVHLSPGVSHLLGQVFPGAVGIAQLLLGKHLQFSIVEELIGNLEDRRVRPGERNQEERPAFTPCSKGQFNTITFITAHLILVKTYRMADLQEQGWAALL